MNDDIPAPDSGGATDTPAVHPAEANPYNAPWGGVNPEDDPEFQNKAPKVRTPQRQVDFEAEFADIVKALRDDAADSDAAGDPDSLTAAGDSDDAWLLTERGTDELAEAVMVDLLTGMVLDRGLALCQVCVSGLVQARRSRVCTFCLRVDRRLAKAHQKSRFLPTTRRRGSLKACVTVDRRMGESRWIGRFINNSYHPDHARWAEQRLWQQMDETFRGNLRLMTMLREFDPVRLVDYREWADAFPPSYSRSLDAYLAYALLHMPWAVDDIRSLIILTGGTN